MAVYLLSMCERRFLHGELAVGVCLVWLLGHSLSKRDLDLAGYNTVSGGTSVFV